MRAAGWMALAGAGALGLAGAYEIGGHHDTLFALLHSAPQAPATVPLTPAQKDVVSFCAWLPDLAADLNAATLRVRVFGDGSDWRWGALSKCDGRSSKLMVASQFYLHALTGSDVEPVRQAATRVARGLLLPQPADAGITDNERLCALGLAMHLLGDTFAHSRLRLRPWDGRDTARQLYDTGAGHFEAGTEPDYMLRRDAVRWRLLSPNDRPADYEGHRWVDWVGTLGGLWSDADGARVLQGRGEAVVKTYGDAGRSAALAGSAGEDSLTERIARDSPAVASAPARQASAPRLFDESSWQSCRQQMAGFPGQAPDCQRVWGLFLARAHQEFGGNDDGAVRPGDRTCRLDVRDKVAVAPGLDEK